MLMSVVEVSIEELLLGALEEALDEMLSSGISGSHPAPGPQPPKGPSW